MSQRGSGYERKERDLYETPEWVTEELMPHLRDDIKIVWEPASGGGKMSTVLKSNYDVIETDIENGHDFLTISPRPADAIVTNPPYVLAKEFIQHSLSIMNPGGCVAMLLRTDFDHARTRQHLFSRCPQFARKVVLTKRIQWFENSTGQPSFNHAWFIWDWKHRGAPTLAYAPLY